MVMEKFNNFIADVARLDGWSSMELLNLLYDYSRKTTGKGEIVEIGTFSGKTTIALAYGQKEKKGKSVYAIDLHKHSQVDQNLRNFDVADYVQQIRNTSSLEGRRWQKPIELLWIDGGHSYVCVSQDIKYFTPHVVEGGHVIFHDYPGVLDKKFRNHLPDDVHKAIQRILLKQPRKWQIVDDRLSDTSTIIFKKLEWSDDMYPKETVLNLVKYRFYELIYKTQNILYSILKDKKYKKLVDTIFHSGK